MKRVLVIGGAGYIGSAVGNHLMGLGCRVTRADVGWYGVHGMDRYDFHEGDYRDLDREFVRGFDVVFLAAAHSSVQMCNADVPGAYRNNVTNVINFVFDKLHPDQRFIYASSSCVYGHGRGLEHDPLIPTDVLSATKSAADVLVAHERAAMEIGELRRRGIHCHLEEHADRHGHRLDVVRDPEAASADEPVDRDAAAGIKGAGKCAI